MRMKPSTTEVRHHHDVLPLKVVDRRPVVKGAVVVKEAGKEVPVRWKGR